MAKAVTVGKNRFRWTEQFEFWKNLSEIHAKSREITEAEKEFAEINELHARKVKQNEHQLVLETLAERRQKAEEAVPKAIGILELQTLEKTIEAVEKLRSSLYERHGSLAKGKNLAEERQREIETAKRKRSLSQIFKH